MVGKIDLRGPRPSGCNQLLLFITVVRYTCVLLYAKMLKETETKVTIFCPIFMIGGILI